MSGAHARLAPSGMERTVACNGWVQLAESLPPAPETEDEKEGTAAHWVAQRMADREPVAEDDVAPNGVPVDEAMLEGGGLWRDAVGMYGVSEMLVMSTRIHPTENYGTPDRYRYDGIEEVLTVWDYKYGHRFVEVFECWQLVNYAIALLEMLALPEDTDIVLVVVQPRSYHPAGSVRHWRTNGTDLRAHVNIMMQAGRRALGPDPEFKTGPHCLDCPARGDCGTLQEATSYAIEFIGYHGAVTPSPEQLGAELTLLDAAEDLVKARITALREQTKAHIRAGRKVRGWELAPVKGRLTWHAPPDAIFALGDVMEIPLRKAAKPITPKQAIDAGIPAAIIEPTYATRSTGAFQLAKQTNIESRKAFGANKV